MATEQEYQNLYDRIAALRDTVTNRLASDLIRIPSFTTEDDMPVVGRKYHIACYGRFRLEGDGSGVIDPP